jgi:hypothetical protein
MAAGYSIVMGRLSAEDEAREAQEHHCDLFDLILAVPFFLLYPDRP